MSFEEITGTIVRWSVAVEALGAVGAELKLKQAGREPAPEVAAALKQVAVAAGLPDLDDLNPESLWKFRVKGFGPLLVAMDSHGGSLYEEVDRKARARRANTLARLGVK